MRALHFGLRVTDLDRSLAFYRAIGYQVIGEVPDTGLGHLTMLKLPGDDFVTLEVVHHPDYAPTDGESPLSHFVIQVDNLDSTRAQLVALGVEVDEPTSPDDSPHSWTAMLVDPEGNRIELVQWPPGHPDGPPQPTYPRPPASRSKLDADRRHPSSSSGKDRRHPGTVGGTHHLVVLPRPMTRYPIRLYHELRNSLAGWRHPRGTSSSSRSARSP